MSDITTIGIDLAKSVFQLHGVDAEGRPALRCQLRRSQMLEFFQRQPPCLIGMEACANAHYWARELGKLGQDVRLCPSSDNLGRLSAFQTGGSGSPLIDVMRFQFYGASAG